MAEWLVAMDLLQDDGITRSVVVHVSCAICGQRLSAESDWRVMVALADHRKTEQCRSWRERLELERHGLVEVAWEFCSYNRLWGPLCSLVHVEARLWGPLCSLVHVEAACVCVPAGPGLVGPTVKLYMRPWVLRLHLSPEELGGAAALVVLPFLERHPEMLVAFESLQMLGCSMQDLAEHCREDAC